MESLEQLECCTDTRVTRREQTKGKQVYFYLKYYSTCT